MGFIKFHITKKRQTLMDINNIIIFRRMDDNYTNITVYEHVKVTEVNSTN